MRSWLERAGFDPRFTSLVLALAAIWIALAVVTDGIFLSPRNLYNLSIQTCVTALMACGMVFIIVARQIDLSVGSLMAFTGMVIAWMQVTWLGSDTTGAAPDGTEVVAHIGADQQLPLLRPGDEVWARWEPTAASVLPGVPELAPQRSPDDIERVFS